MTQNFKATKKSIETFALQYDGHNTELVLDLLNKNKSEPAILEEDSKTILITKTFGGEKQPISLPVNNWMLLDVDGVSYWSVDPEIFSKTYEKVEGNTYKKVPIQIDVIEFSSLKDEDIQDILKFIGEKNQTTESVKEVGYISIDTLEGKENIFPTDILARGVKGELYPIKKENFDIIFEVL